DWTTASELNNLGFEIERSLDDNIFVTVGFVEGKGTSTETNYYSFTDRISVNGRSTISYRLKQVDYDGTSSYSNIIQVEVDVPVTYTLNQNYPNPFNPSTKIEYTLPVDGFVELNVYDIMGKEIATLVNEQKPAGTYEIVFDASEFPSGVYFYTIKAVPFGRQAGSFVSTKKMMFLK
ncbi:MAG: hypothetical protein A2W11_07805, partial [Ignavibacteria bacterium RBG_16_35_7]